MKITIETAKVYRLRGFKPESFAWADIVIRSWKGGGSIDVQSDYGSYAYQWGSTGRDDIREFLVGLDYGYFMTKCHPSRGYETDWDGTAKEVRRLILEDRRIGGITADFARKCIDGVDAVEWGESLFYEMRDHPELSTFYADGDYPRKTVRQGQCNGFWTVIWPEIVKVWREELQAPHIPTDSFDTPIQGVIILNWREIEPSKPKGEG